MPSYDEKRRRLMQVIQENAIVFKDVQLFSKIKSPYYYDINLRFTETVVFIVGQEECRCF
jgi:orotate phosphoribosyltransferase